METSKLSRVVEPELMDDDEQAQAYAKADFSASDAAIIERIRELYPHALGSRVLDLGCGPGNICHRLALAFPEAQVCGVDGAAAMLRLARQKRDDAGLAPARLEYIQALLPDDPLPAAHFSAVVSNSLLHHLHDPNALWRTLRKVAAPGACVYIKDLRRPAARHEVEPLVERYVGTEPEILQNDFRNSLFAAFTRLEVQEQLAAHDLSYLHCAEVDDRYLEIWGYMPG